jgi:hypothetical protein
MSTGTGTGKDPDTNMSTAAGVDGRMMVLDTSNTGEEGYLNTWVAEVALAPINCEALRECLRHKDIVLRVREAQAQVDNHCGAVLRDEAKLNAAREQLARELQALLRLSKCIATAQLDDEESRRASGVQTRSAFVTFNHAHSAELVLCAYAAPRKRSGVALHFRGSLRLAVGRADEPLAIKWENLDERVSWTSNTTRHLCVTLQVALVLLAAFAAIYACNIAVREFYENSFVDTSLCAVDLPARYRGSYFGSSAGSATIVRNSTRDSLCGAGRVWLSYSEADADTRGDTRGAWRANDACVTPCVALGAPPSSPALVEEEDADDTACYTLSVQEGCPSLHEPPELANADAACARAAAASAGASPVLELQRGAADGLEVVLASIETLQCCRKYAKERQVVACYCKQELTERGLLGALSAEESSLCAAYVAGKASSHLLMLIPALVSLVVNITLRHLVTYLATRFQRDRTATELQLSIVWRCLVAQLLNSCVMVIILHAALPDSARAGLSGAQQGVAILRGNYNDLTRSWYIVVGQSIILTMASNLFAAHVDVLLWWLIVCPLYRWYYSMRAASQEMLDWAYSTPAFGMTFRYSNMLNTVLITSAFSGSMPVLLPLAALFFSVTYWFEKTALLRYYARPPAYNDSLPHNLVEALPCALLVHCLMSFWAFGNADLMPSATLGQGEYQATAALLVKQWLDRFQQAGDQFGIARKASQVVALPHLALGLGVAVALGLRAAFRTAETVLPHAQSLLNRVGCCYASSRKSHRTKVAPAAGHVEKAKVPGRWAHLVFHRRGWGRRPAAAASPAFTEPYLRAVRTLERQEAMRVWPGARFVEQLGRCFQFFPRDETKGAEPSNMLRTWEVIAAQDVVASYRMEANPFYRDAAAAASAAAAGAAVLLE